MPEERARPGARRRRASRRARAARSCTRCSSARLRRPRRPTPGASRRRRPSWAWPRAPRSATRSPRCSRGALASPLARAHRRRAARCAASTRSRSPSAPTRRSSRGVIDVARRRGRRDDAGRRLQERPRSAGERSRGARRARLRGPAPALRARGAARGRARGRGRPLVPRAPARAGASARYTAGRARGARGRARARLRAAGASRFAVSPRPHRGAVPDLPGPRRPVLLERGGDAARGPAEPPTSARRPDRRAEKFAPRAYFGRSALIPFLAPPQVPACPHAPTGRRRGKHRPHEHFHVHAQHKAAPKAVGLYDPRFEHDACGVGMVARLDNQPTHEVVTRAIDGAREPRAPRRLRRRPEDRRRRRDPDADARRAAARGRRLRAAAAGRLRRADVLPADRRGSARRARGAARADRRAPRASSVLGWRDVPIDARAHRRRRGRLPAGDPPAVRRRRRGAGARPGRLRAQALRDPPRLRAAAHGGPRPVHHLELLADDQLQGHADQLPAGGVLPRPARRALQERAGAGALALLDQHLPELGARPPLPGDLPQRRDQHA